MVFMRLSMRKIEETLILCRSIMALTTRKAARCCGNARSILAEYLAHVERAGLFRPSQKNSMIFFGRTCSFKSLYALSAEKKVMTLIG